MRAVVVHAPHDLRIESAPPQTMGQRDVTVRIARGGICGSDLHYFHAGGFGTVRLRAPMILGHEVAGVVEAVGPDVGGVRVGARVAVSPSRPCGACAYCRQGRRIHCLDMRFYGSAMRFPHVDGAFRDRLVCDADQVHDVGEADLSEAAFCEPLAVALHAAGRAGPLLGARVLVTGCGPIGALAVLASRQAGAAEIVATDVAAAPLAAAAAAGADRALDVAADAEALAPWTADKGAFDVLFECSGRAEAFVGALPALRPGAVAVQIGTGGAFAVPVSVLVAKEIAWRGAFRFDAEFALAARFVRERRVDVRPLLTATLPVERAHEAFELASDRGRAVKVHLAFA